MTWRDILVKRIGWKIFSLVLALIIWSTFKQSDGALVGWFYDVTNATQTRDFIGVPLSVLNNAKDGHDYRLTPNAVDVSISGEPEAVRDLAITDLTLFVDMRGSNEKQSTNRVQINHSVPLARVLINPPYVQVNRVEPASATNSTNRASLMPADEAAIESEPRPEIESDPTHSP